MMTIPEIRARYPHPVTRTAAENTADTTAYCVGGAIYRSTGRGLALNFPISPSLANALRFFNPCLPDNKADQFADDIITYNDAGDFEGAWRHAPEAFAYRQERLPAAPGLGEI